MTFEQRMLWKRHPEYAEGFAAHVHGDQLPKNASAPFRAGYEGYEQVKRLMSENGFVAESDGGFSVKLST